MLTFQPIPQRWMSPSNLSDAHSKNTFPWRQPSPCPSREPSAAPLAREAGHPPFVHSWPARPMGPGGAYSALSSPSVAMEAGMGALQPPGSQQEVTDSQLRSQRKGLTASAGGSESKGKIKREMEQ